MPPVNSQDADNRNQGNDLISKDLFYHRSLAEKPPINSYRWKSQYIKGDVYHVGFHNSYLASITAKRGFYYLGVDVTNEYHAQEENALENISEELRNNISFSVQDPSVYVPEHKFDTVIITDILQFVAKPEKVLDNATRVMKDDGIMLVTVPYGRSLPSRFHTTFRIQDFIDLVSEFVTIDSIDIKFNAIGCVAHKKNNTSNTLDTGTLFALSEKASLDKQKNLIAIIKSQNKILNFYRSENESLLKFLANGTEVKAFYSSRTVRVFITIFKAMRKTRSLVQKIGGKIKAPARHAKWVIKRYPLSGKWLSKEYRGEASQYYQLRKLIGKNNVNLLNLCYDYCHSNHLKPVIDLQPNRLCYVLHNSWPYSSGGYATRAHGLAKGLTDRGWEVCSITRPGFPHDLPSSTITPDSLPMSDTLDGVTYHRILYPKRNGMHNHSYMQQSVSIYEDYFRQLRPSVVMAATSYQSGVGALLAARRLGIPFVYEVRGWWEVTRVSRNPSFARQLVFKLMKGWENFVAYNADHVFTLTSPMRDELVRRGVAREKIDLLPNSCDTERFLPQAFNHELASQLGISDGVPVIGYIGTFVDYEGLEVLVRACSLLKQQGVIFRLMLVGNEDPSGQGHGKITSNIMEIANRDGLDDWLILTGRVPHHMVEQYYSLITIAPFPRLGIPVCEMVSPMKPLEAMSMEKLVIASDVGGMAEMVLHENTGMTFKKGDPESLMQVLRRAIEDKELRVNLGKRARQFVQNERTWEKTAQTADAMLRSLAK